MNDFVIDIILRCLLSCFQLCFIFCPKFIICYYCLQWLFSSQFPVSRVVWDLFNLVMFIDISIHLLQYKFSVYTEWLKKSWNVSFISSLSHNFNITNPNLQKAYQSTLKSMVGFASPPCRLYYFLYSCSLTLFIQFFTKSLKQL